MTPERFDHLADAYGADLRRWPQGEQAAARALLERGDVQAHAALAHARTLDSLLDNHRLAAVEPGLARRVAASAQGVNRPSFWQSHRSWWPRLSLVGVGLAGIAAGMLAVSLSLPLGNGAEALPSIFDQNDADIVYSISAEDSEQ